MSLDHLFPRAVPVMKRRTIWRSYGEVGVGKTSFALSAPGPMLIQSLDNGLEGVIEKAQQDRPDTAIYAKIYKWAPGDAEFSQAHAEDVRDQIEKDLRLFIKNTTRGTLIWDKESEIWEVFRYAEFGGPNAIFRPDYAKLYQRVGAIFDAVHKTDLNFGAIQAMTDEWESFIDPRTGKKSGRTTGRRIPRGCDRLDEWVQTELLHIRRVEDGRSRFYLQVGKCRQNNALLDQEFDQTTFSDFAQLLMPDSDAEDWA